jgi:hypothetical protein
MTEAELITYKKISLRIKELEKKLEWLESDIPSRVVRDKIEATRLTLKANQEMMLFLFGENHLIQ